MKATLVLFLLFLACCEKPCPKEQKRVQFNCSPIMYFDGTSMYYIEDCDTKCVAKELLK